jgi:hypothetical protein
LLLYMIRADSVQASPSVVSERTRTAVEACGIKIQGRRLVVGGLPVPAIWWA